MHCVQCHQVLAPTSAPQPLHSTRLTAPSHFCNSDVKVALLFGRDVLGDQLVQVSVKIILQKASRNIGPHATSIALYNVLHLWHEFFESHIKYFTLLVYCTYYVTSGSRMQVYAYTDTDTDTDTDTQTVANFARHHPLSLLTDQDHARSKRVCVCIHIL